MRALYLRAALGWLCALCAGLSGPTLADSFQMQLEAAAGRSVPVSVFHPAQGCSNCPLIIFSHGALATPERYRRLLEVWSDSGFVIAAPLHVDSEMHPHRDDYGRDAVLPARFEDFALLVTGTALRATLGERGLHTAPGVIAAGHSFGGLIAQVAAGATMQAVATLPEALIEARESVLGVVALSPPGPIANYVGEEDWQSIVYPMLVVTGTTDIQPGFMDDWKMHLSSFENSALSPAYALVFDGQDHYFNGSFGRPKDILEEPDAQALAALNEVCLDFMQMLLRDHLPSQSAWLARSNTRMEALVSTAVRVAP